MKLLNKMYVVFLKNQYWPTETQIYVLSFRKQFWFC